MNILPDMNQTDDTSQFEKVTYLADLAREASDARQPFEAAVNDNINIFWFGDTSQPGVDEIIVQLSQCAVIACTDIQTKEPPSITLEPVETGEPGEYYWAGPPQAALQLTMPSMDPMTGMMMPPLLLPAQVQGQTDPITGEQHPPLQIDPMVAGQLKALAIPEELQPALPPGAIRPEWLVNVCDQTVADTYQTVFDVFWRRSDGDRHVRKDLLDDNIQGWSWMLYGFDDTAKKHDLTHLPITQVYIDPTVSDISEAAYAGIDLPMDAAAAKVRYPELSDEIDEFAVTGSLTAMDGATNLSSIYSDVSFKRPMVFMRIFWIRNQLIPLTPDEAQQTGDVTQQEVPDETQAPPVSDDQTAGGDASPGMPDGDEPPAAAAVQVGGPTPPPLPPMRTALVHSQTGEELTPDHPAWPTKIGIRQLTVLTGKGGTGRLVADAESEFFDIPITHNVNIPYPGQRPWGQGEPERLKALQRAASRSLGSMVAHADNFAYPTSTISRSMRDALGPAYAQGKVKPGLTFTIEDELYDRANGNIEIFQYPPPMSQALPDVYETTKAAATEISGHAEVLQGRAQPQVKSGRAIELLQSSASSMIGFKSQRTGDMLTRLAKLELHSLIWRLEVSDIYRIVSKYPVHVLEAICERAKSIDWDITVTVQTGSTMAQQRRAAAESDLQFGMIDRLTYWEDTQRDPQTMERRRLQQMAEDAKMMGPAPAATGDQQGGPQGQAPPPGQPGQPAAE